MLWDGGNGYKAYVFEESTRHCTIDCKGQGRKEVIMYHTSKLRTPVSCTPQKPPKIGKTAL